MLEKTFKVEGMTCDHCVRTVKNALLAVEGVSEVEVSLSSGIVKIKVEREIPFEKIKKAIEEWGYKVIS